jgi:hypothetical protein
VPLKVTGVTISIFEIYFITGRKFEYRAVFIIQDQSDAPPLVSEKYFRGLITFLMHTIFKLVFE